MFNIEEEVKGVIENDLLDDLLFYGQEYPQYRDKMFEEFEKQSIKLIRQLKKELDEDDEI